MPRNLEGKCGLDHTKLLEEWLDKRMQGPCICPDCDLTLMYDETKAFTEEDWNNIRAQMREHHGIARDEDI
jgi:hypothetical protein